MTGRQAKSGAARKRALVSCDRCKLRRGRCIRDNADEPCADCKQSGVQCESKLPRKQRVYGSVETLSLRYRALESLVQGLFPQEDVQNTNTLFKVAAARNIQMPAMDDFTPADIFSSNHKGLKETSPSQQRRDSSQKSLTTRPGQQSPSAAGESMESVENDLSTAIAQSRPRNPLGTLVAQSTGLVEELIPSKNVAATHYFGPSSTVRLATIIRGLVARCRAVAGPEFPVLRAFTSNASSAISISRGSTNHSDEEQLLHEASHATDNGRKSRKRSRSQMEGSSDQWQQPGGLLEPETIADLLPPRPFADALVATYFDTTHNLVPLLNRGHFQTQLESIYSRKLESLKNFTDIGWLVVVALVFTYSLEQLPKEEAERTSSLRLTLVSFANSHFRDLLTTACLINVQALMLLMFHHHNRGQKSSSWLLIGLSAQMAITMGMHQDDSIAGLDQDERNTRRLVWWWIYIIEKSLCNVLGRPSCIDDQETSMRLPDVSSADQNTLTADFMDVGYKLCRMSYSIRQRAYFHDSSSGERSPTLAVAMSLLRECDEFSASIPTYMALDFPSTAPLNEKARVIVLHIYYYYTRCVVSRDFLLQKVQSNIRFMEDRTLPTSDDWQTTLMMSEHCVESAHRSLQCASTGFEFSKSGYFRLDLFFVFHCLLLVCADFLARPKDQLDSPKDIERKNTVRAILEQTRTMPLGPTYTFLNRIVLQFASITGVIDDNVKVSSPLQARSESPRETQAQYKLDAWNLGDDVTWMENWFAGITSHFGIDFFDGGQSTDVGQMSNANPSYPGYQSESRSDEVEDWTDKTLKGMHTL